ncbi:MAG: FecR family protein [Bacteroidales bacterium]|nr:FecR family protein [Bacteroidales bacterium]
MNVNFENDDLIIRFLAGETTASENQVLLSWLSESPENQEYFDAFRNIWLASAQASFTFDAHGSGINKHNNPQENTNLHFSEKKSIIKSIINYSVKVAAALLMLVATGAVIFYQFKVRSSNNQIITVESTLGSRSITVLPDGTKVWLNSGSKLTYNGNYNEDNREVRLVGEAYFNVVTNPSRPFVVKTEKLNIKAVGTIFNVKAYPEDKEVVTTLVKGKVFVEGKDMENHDFSLQMKPMETITYYKNLNNPSDNNTREYEKSESGKTIPENTETLTDNIPVTKDEQVNIELFTSWKDNRWIIEKQKLGDLYRDIERRYNIRIQFLSDTIKQFHFTGTLENETIEQIMVTYEAYNSS